jgi:hypothetical protein
MVIFQELNILNQPLFLKDLLQYLNFLFKLPNVMLNNHVGLLYVHQHHNLKVNHTFID